VGGFDGVVDIEVDALVGAGRIGAFLAKEIRNREATASSWRTWPKVNVRRNVPNVEGARTPVNNRPIPPWRSRSMSSMESAPATIPATSAGTFRCALTPPVAFKVSVAETRSAKPAR